ncbi:hypothetical protein BJ742DRAFT_774614 [Cladochytrium replicatum]|nr:hypothetical protein BJ742DRAFT_774614 [Cladochytrium replicatum]
MTDVVFIDPLEVPPSSPTDEWSSIVLLVPVVVFPAEVVKHPVHLLEVGAENAKHTQLASELEIADGCVMLDDGYATRDSIVLSMQVTRRDSTVSVSFVLLHTEQLSTVGASDVGSGVIDDAFRGEVEFGSSVAVVTFGKNTDVALAKTVIVAVVFDVTVPLTVIDVPLTGNGVGVDTVLFAVMLAKVVVVGVFDVTVPFKTKEVPFKPAVVLLRFADVLFAVVLFANVVIVGASVDVTVAFTVDNVAFNGTVVVLKSVAVLLSKLFIVDVAFPGRDVLFTGADVGLILSVGVLLATSVNVGDVPFTGNNDGLMKSVVVVLDENTRKSVGLTAEVPLNGNVNVPFALAVIVLAETVMLSDDVAVNSLVLSVVVTLLPIDVIVVGTAEVTFTTAAELVIAEDVRSLDVIDIENSVDEAPSLPADVAVRALVWFATIVVTVSMVRVLDPVVVLSMIGVTELLALDSTLIEALVGSKRLDSVLVCASLWVVERSAAVSVEEASVTLALVTSTVICLVERTSLVAVRSLTVLKGPAPVVGESAELVPPSPESVLVLVSIVLLRVVESISLRSVELEVLVSEAATSVDVSEIDPLMLVTSALLMVVNGASVVVLSVPALERVTPVEIGELVTIDSVVLVTSALLMVVDSPSVRALPVPASERLLVDEITVLDAADACISVELPTIALLTEIALDMPSADSVDELSKAVVVPDSALLKVVETGSLKSDVLAVPTSVDITKEVSRVGGSTGLIASVDVADNVP